MASIGMAILYNMGTNVLLGQISFITMALAAVLQLAVTMDYSIFLWHAYNEQRARCDTREEAMAVAIRQTLSSVVGSAVTTVAGFVALCFMSFRLGLDMGLVMAKGVVLGVIGCVTILPAMVLMLDRPLQRTRHRPLIPDLHGFARGVTKVFPVILVAVALLVVPAWRAYGQANGEVYYNLGAALPDTMEYVIAQNKRSDTFDVATTHMLLLDSDAPEKDVCDMVAEMEKVDGVSTLYNGLIDYTDAVGEAADGARQLSDGADSLAEGAQNLSDGAKALSDGIGEFDQKAVEKLLDALDGDLSGLPHRIEAMADVIDGYRFYSGIAEGQTGMTQFIIKTAGI